VSGIDELLVERAAGQGAFAVVAIAVLLGLRHATDPDHLVAVSTLVASADEHRGRLAARLGAAWGVGHALTLVAFGLPIVLFHAFIPDVAQRAAEALVGVIIVGLALRLLYEWRRGALHAHTHEHEGGSHAHLHSHARPEHSHRVRTSRQAFAIGTVHGLAGSAGVTVLLLAAVPDRVTATAALAALAVGATVSMTVFSSALGSALGSARGQSVFAAAAPVVGFVAAGFGTWYAAAALFAA
jgi:ABC-type nickel/cobalt efflux system permease component RcnA